VRELIEGRGFKSGVHPFHRISAEVNFSYKKAVDLRLREGEVIHAGKEL
jgi:hypothetical protein